ncbi:DUF4007 family protein [Parashewanella tropica]|uniref:DUF4007 family protein n=1 Tax=Parashewanella tropica TaxID=2547970 RepID=UPI001059F65B|nr:DUF4007 family protein [Parashewanella tropica]
MKAKFTGHDTFPLRYGWLYKAVNHLNLGGKIQTSNEESVRKAIVNLGVGKNMVNAIRYWAEACNVMSTNTKSEQSVTLLGNYLFEDKDHEGNGRDPYLEQIGSVWLIHFWLNFNFETLTSYRYFFNFSNVQHFEKSKLISDAIDDCSLMVTNDIGNPNTIKKDVDCFLNTYCKKIKNTSSKKKETVNEDHFTSPLAELDLVQELGGGFYISKLDERESLPIEIFIYSLLHFMRVETAESKINTIDFDSLLTKPCSPGRIFRLSETGLGQKLDEAQEITNSDISWIDSLGLRQVKISDSLLKEPQAFLNKYYGN